MWDIIAQILVDLGFSAAEIGVRSLLKGSPLRFHNTLSGKTEVFKPLKGKAVKMYNCGPTVYDYAHIGNLRSYVFADTIRRTLDAWGFETKQVINITDFGHLVTDGDEGDDKMTKGLLREGLELTLANMRVLAEKYTEAFLNDLKELGIDTSPERITFPRASDYIKEQIELIQRLEQKGFVYKISDGVYFDTAKFTGYGKLGNINLAGQQAGIRVEQNKEKRNAADFIVWKSDGKVGWESPWGMGFPGWHIECTAMIFKLLGEQIDIHTGGVDHISIHHNNEIAQAEAASGKQFVQYWMHGEFITIDSKKISKSLGNTIYLQDFAKRGLSPLALRYWFLTGHYRSPMNFTWEAVEGANETLKRLHRFYFDETTSEAVWNPEQKNDFLKNFYETLANDLDTPKAIALMWEMIKDPAVPTTQKKEWLREIDKVLGLGFSDKSFYTSLGEILATVLPTDVQELLKDRELARTAKDFVTSDTLRKQIEEKGYELKDTPEGQKVTKK